MHRILNQVVLAPSVAPRLEEIAFSPPQVQLQASTTLERRRWIKTNCNTLPFWGETYLKAFLDNKFHPEEGATLGICARDEGSCEEHVTFMLEKQWNAPKINTHLCLKKLFFQDVKLRQHAEKKSFVAGGDESIQSTICPRPCGCEWMMERRLSRVTLIRKKNSQEQLVLHNFTVCQVEDLR